MSMPVFYCPCCRNPLTWELVFSDEGIREMLLALIRAYPGAEKLLRPLLAYVGLFAPEKTVMRNAKIANRLNELIPLIRSAQIERNGRTYAVPLDYWIRALDEVLTRRDTGTLRLPLSTHGYLFEVLAGYSNKAEASSETRLEKQRAGHAGVGSNPARPPHRPTEGPVRLEVSPPTPEFREAMKSLNINLKSNEKGN